MDITYVNSENILLKLIHHVHSFMNWGLSEWPIWFKQQVIT